MESVTIKLNDSLAFDAILKNSLPEGGDLTIITKDNATITGSPVVMIAFTVEVNGRIEQVQAVTTMKLFVSVLRALGAKYGV